MRDELRRQKTAELYSCMQDFAGEGIAIGLDEVGRGALAGPLAVGAVALKPQPQVFGLDDSKKLTPRRREELSEFIKQDCAAWTVAYILPQDIDKCGMAASLKSAFTKALKDCLAKLKQKPAAILIDGNPLNLGAGEVSIVKGDSKCACIAAASIVAKVARDALMVEWANEFSAYNFESNKGYGSAQHIKAIKSFGPCKLHRKSFLSNIV